MSSKKQIVLVTGASSGIGRATALRLARRGHTVVAAVRNPEGATQLREAIAEESLPIEVERVDVEHDDSVQGSFARILAKVGRVDVLVNNAGISISDAVEVAPMKLAKRIFEVNYFGTIRMTQAVLPTMRARRSGTIINISSISALVAIPALAHYAGSKVAMEAATETLAQEVRRFGIRVAIIEPGVTKTEMFSRRSNLRPIDPKSPYLDDIKDLYGYFKSALADPLMPEDVASAIEHAMTTDEPRFRYLIGKDAQLLTRLRRESSDEDWISGAVDVAERAKRGDWGADTADAPQEKASGS